MIKKLQALIIVLFCVISANKAVAQLDSQHALGVRFGSATGVNYRYALTEDRAIEGIFSVQSSSRTSRFRIVGLYEFHKPLAENFSWYYGFGGSLGRLKYKAYTDANGNRIDTSSDLLLSIDGVVGVSYEIPTTPLSLSVDLKPYLDVLQESSIKLIDPFGFSIRYKF